MSEETAEEYTSKEENERQYALIDQLLSMHSSLRDRYERRAFWLNTVQIGASLFLSVFAFVPDDVIRSLDYDPAKGRYLLGVSAIVVLLISITEFRVDWKSVGSRHSEAARHLAELKAKYRKAFSEAAGEDREKNSRLAIDYDRLMALLPPIPEQYFIPLKASHRFKIYLSDRVSRNPKAPIWFLWLVLRLKGISSALKEEDG
ncbi:MAG: hypothetical protein OXF54_08560 [Caldilineaceae bacterium]|nr:hypothetical protein [Caldilineaceae bacterium]